MDCVKCGAPLPARTSRCSFCGALNDVDLRRPEGGFDSTGITDRTCPRCEKALCSVRIDIAGGMSIERCDTCLGLFFDPRESDAVLNAGAGERSNVDFKRLQRIIEDEAPNATHQSMYVKCPCCKKVMNRDSFGARSGVVVDRCADHGVWMDGGELSQLLKWVRAGGRSLAEARKRDEQREAELKKRVKRALPSAMNRPLSESRRSFEFELDDVMGLPYLVRAVLRLFDL